ncbi:hypothetical protein PVAND_004589 [Polypedilum vanderplanki]|uniref:Transmembrane protein n=1 Tax=Polypedilum vanderplanki TaxID=319348 RepID=A0A9J6BYK6_POLVA|nr:hypothetical protein PVAND_004589 [Polypedilum vanderplanki]
MRSQNFFKYCSLSIFLLFVLQTSVANCKVLINQDDIEILTNQNNHEVNQMFEILQSIEKIKGEKLKLFFLWELYCELTCFGFFDKDLCYNKCLIEINN